MGWFRKLHGVEVSKGDLSSPNSDRGIPSSRTPQSGTRDLSPPSSAANSGTFRAAPRARTKPLVVFADDSAIVTLQMLQLLTGAGYEVATTSNGAAAVRMAQELRPDLVLLDVEMPEMKGTEACEKIKRNPKTSGIPVVLMTGHDDAAHLRDGFRSGCDGYIPKGTKDEEVLRKLQLKLLPGTSLQSK